MLKESIFAFATFVAASVAAAAAFELTSPDLAKEEMIPEIFTFNGLGCTGANMSPSLSWKNPPAGTKSFAIIVHDPDAKTGVGGFRHWVVVNVPPGITGIAKGDSKVGAAILPEGGEQITTDFGTLGWGGPCPPRGDAPHHYQFTVYALKVEKLELPANATAGLAGFMVNSNAIAKATFTRPYAR